LTGSSRSAAHRNYEHALEHLRRHWEPSTCLTTEPTNDPATGGYLTS
jgi:hypothetical protein